MVQIIKKVEIYNLAYKIAWPHVAENAQLTAQQRSEAGLFLSRAIHGSIRAGRTDAVLIAAEATTDIQRIQTLRLNIDRSPVPVKVEPERFARTKNFFRSRFRIPQQ